MTVLSKSLLEVSPLVIAALHLPDFNATRERSMAWFEDYVLTNAGVFARAGIPAIKLQDETRETGCASISTVAQMAALGRLLKQEYPSTSLGVIVQAHDAQAPLAIAHAAGADFVRMKVFTGQVMSSEGPKDGLGVAAGVYRHALRRPDIAILADVHDRTSVPRDDIPLEQAAGWTSSLGADALVITGKDFADTIERIGRVRSARVERPILVGGGVTAENIGSALASAQGVIVSRAIMRKEAAENDLVRWDLHACEQLMEAAHRLPTPLVRHL